MAMLGGELGKNIRNCTADIKPIPKPEP